MYRPSLANLLSERKPGLLAKWLEETLRVYPTLSTACLSGSQDPFRNPVGHRLKEGLSILLDTLIRPEKQTESALESIVRLAAVQDISAGQAVAFLFRFKRIARERCASEAAACPDEFQELDRRIDEMALLAFDLYMKCRDQIGAIKANEAQRLVRRPHAY